MHRTKQQITRCFVLALILGIWIAMAPAQEMDSCATVQENRKGTITALWYDIDPFIFEDNDGELQGVEFELMESFAAWVKKKYGYEVRVNWTDAGSINGIYDRVHHASNEGIFGWYFFSITPERRQEVDRKSTRLKSS